MYEKEVKLQISISRILNEVVEMFDQLTAQSDCLNLGMC